MIESYWGRYYRRERLHEFLKLKTSLHIPLSKSSQQPITDSLFEHNYRGEPILLRRPGRPHTHRNCHRNAVGLHGGGHGRPHDHGGGLGRPHDHRFRVSIVKIFKMGMPMGVPMGVPMGILMGVPMGMPIVFL